MKLNRILVALLFIALAWSCKNDDNDITEVEFQTLTETAIENDAEIVEYLKTHFYNYEEFETPPADFDYKVIFDTIAGDNAEKTSLFDSPELKNEVITVDSDDFGLDEEEIAIEHTLYYLVANEGEGGVAPMATDSTYITYVGTLLDDSVFDSNLATPVWLDLVSTVKGFGRGMTKFKSGGATVENEDGTFSVLKPGAGALFIPSGLAYFFGSTPGESYAPIIFKINTLAVEESDHDNDGIPSWREDLDGDSNVNNDDTDGNSFPNYFDADDDGDGISTLEEISDENGNLPEPDEEGNITYPDSDMDGIADYLDSDS